MKTRCINPHRQKQFYHLKTARVCKKQTKSEAYISKISAVKDTEFKFKIHNDYFNDFLEWTEKQLRQAEQKEKEILIMYAEHYFGRPLTLTERKHLLEQANKLIVVI